MEHSMKGDTNDLTIKGNLSRSHKQPDMPTDGVNHHLPNEIWQNIFGFLDLHDLLRSLRVCTEWRDNIQSTDPTLRDKMFKDRVVPPNDESRSGEKATSRNERLSNTTDKTKSSIPTVTVNLRAGGVLLWVPGSFPQAMIRFEVEFNTDYGYGFRPDDFDRLSNFPSGTLFHPILLDLDRRLPLVDNVFLTDEGEPYPHFSVDSFDSLDNVLEKMRIFSRSGNDGSWEDMLLCVPAQPRINLVFDYTYYDSRRNYALLGESGCGVTMGQFVRAFRDQLEHIEEDVRGFPQEMLTYCSGECWEKRHEDGY